MNSLLRPSDFFNLLRQGDLLGPSLSADEVSGCNALTTAMGQDEWPVSWAAYGLATAFHETAGTMRPIKEYGGEAYFRRKYDPAGLNPDLARRLGNTEIGDGARFAGRGYVQLTGRANYQRASEKLGRPLVEKPDLAMNAEIAAKIMVAGMRDGWFTGKGLKHYLPVDLAATRAQFTAARRIINGQDRADMIAGYAKAFQVALLAGDWS